MRNEKSDKTSSIFEIHSTYSNNFGKYLPLKRESTNTLTRGGQEFNISFKQHNNSLSQNKSYSNCPNFGEYSDSNYENNNINNNQ